jgi:hypothetical protein
MPRKPGMTILDIWPLKGRADKRKMNYGFTFKYNFSNYSWNDFKPLNIRKK